MNDFPVTPSDQYWHAHDRRTGHAAAMERAAQARLAAAQATHYVHRADDGAVVQLGNKKIADAQKAADGDWIRRICGGAR